MANSRVLLSDLKPGKSSSAVDVRLLRFWEARNVRRGGELMWLDMLMVDTDATIMQATIFPDQVPAFRPRLTAGTMYSISGFDVAKCKPSFRLTDSALKILFSRATSLVEITEPVTPLPVEGFRFRNQTELFALANTESHLPDIIGELTAVKSSVSEPPEAKNHLMATIKMDNNVSVTLSLFDERAVAFHRRLESMSVPPKVIVATSINPKMVGGRLFLNTTSGTHLHLDRETVAGETLFYQLVARDTGLSPAAPLLKKYAKVEPITIAELNNFVVNAPSQEIDFLCSGRVSRIDVEKGWCYVACAKCSKKLQRSVSSFMCGKCDNAHAVGTLRYRVEMSVSDNTAEGVFVCFDAVMSRLHNLSARDAGQMLAVDGVNPEDTHVPPFIMDMEGKTYTFQVRVSTYNFTANHQTFTITRILNARDPQPLPDFNDNDGGNNGGGGDMPGRVSTTTELEVGGSSAQGSTENGTGTDGENGVKTDETAEESSKVTKKPRVE